MAHSWMVRDHFRGPFQFVLDTGTDSSLIDAHLAQELGLDAVDKVTLLAAAGQKTVPRMFVQTAGIGQAIGEDLELLATDLDSVFRGTTVRGVLGQDFLQAFDILLDYKKGVVTFLSPGAAAPLGGVRVPISLEHGRPAILWKIAARRELRLLLDSGSSSPTFFRTDIPNFHRCLLQVCRQTITTSVSDATAFSGMLSSLVIGIPPCMMFQLPTCHNRPRETRLTECCLRLYFAVFTSTITSTTRSLAALPHHVVIKRRFNKHRKRGEVGTTPRTPFSSRMSQPSAHWRFCASRERNPSVQLPAC